MVLDAKHAGYESLRGGRDISRVDQVSFGIWRGETAEGANDGVDLILLEE